MSIRPLCHSLRFVAPLLALLTLFWAESAEALIERGRVYSRNPHHIAVEFNGIVTYFRKSGQRVEKGDLLIETSTDDFQNWLQRTQVSLDNKQTQLEVDSAVFETTKKVQESRKVLYTAQLKNEQVKFDLLRRGLSAGERRKIEIEIELLELDLEALEEEHGRQERLIAKGFAVAESLEPYARRLASKKLALKTARFRQEQKLKGPEPEMLIEQEAEVERLRLQLQRHTKRMMVIIAEGELGLAIRQAEVDKLQHLIAKRSRESKLAKQVAVRPGVFFLRKYRSWIAPSGWATHKVGVQKWTGDIVGDLIDPDELQIEVFVHEADVDSLAIDMPVAVSIAALDRKFEGRLTEISQLGKDLKDYAAPGETAPLSQQAYFRVVVELPAAATDLVVGMSAVCRFGEDRE